MESEGLIRYTDGTETDGAVSDTGALKSEQVHHDGATTITERDFSYDLSEMQEMPENGFTSGWLG
jgi:hypothetical protein